MTARTGMAMRAKVSRQSSADKDPYGTVAAESNFFEHTVPCHVGPSSIQPRRLGDDGKIIGVNSYIMWAERNADIKAEDTVKEIRNLRGDVVFGGLFRVVGPPRLQDDHMEAFLEEYG